MTLTLDPEKIVWLGWPETKAVMAALQGKDDPAAQSARFVGGAVRDALLGLVVEDIDIACRLTPDETTRRLKAAGIKVAPTGIDHGTVTAVTGGRAFEITTLRRDVEHFGRRARVHFTTDWAADAARRDFTINALYAGADGRIFDPLGGTSDLRAGKVRFIGDADERIKEDALRILRFFRFHAWYGRGEMDSAGLAACVKELALLDILSIERVTKEILKLLAAPRPAATVQKMCETGILRHVLPQAENIPRLARLEEIELGLEKADPLRRLAALLPASALKTGAPLRLSNRQQKRLLAITAPMPEVTPGLHGRKLVEALYRHGPDHLADQALLNWAATPAPAGDAGWRALLERIAETPIPRFPLKGADIVARGAAPGPEVGRILVAVESLWIKAGLPPGRAPALKLMDKVLALKT